jgi:hypothetical protein
MNKATQSGTTAGAAAALQTPDRCADSFTLVRPVGGFGTTGNTRRLPRAKHWGFCTNHHIGY